MERLWTIAQVAEAFHVLPPVAARHLDDDAGLTIDCLSLLRYADMYRLKDDKDAVKRLKDNPLMVTVQENDAALALEG